MSEESWDYQPVQVACRAVLIDGTNFLRWKGDTYICTCKITIAEIDKAIAWLGGEAVGDEGVEEEV